MTLAPEPSALESIHFGGLDIAYTAEVLEPRPWTVLQSEWLVELAALAPAGPILEVCCGAGHIGLAAAHASGRPLVQVDADPAACALARRNADAAGLADRVSVVCATIEGVRTTTSRYPLILADPPYIASAEVGRFPQDPLLAIDGGDDGLALAEQCLGLFADLLAPQGRALLQLGRLDGTDALYRRFRGAVRPTAQRSAGEDRNVVLFERAGSDAIAPSLHGRS